MIQLLTSPGSRWPALLPGNRHSEIWAAYLELLRSERLTYTELRKNQEEQLIEVLRHCKNYVPYYRDRWKDGMPVGIDALEQYPILSRRDLASNFDLLAANRLPPGQSAFGESFTSGSTGEPVRVRTTNMTELWLRTLYLRELEWGRFDTTKTFAAIRYYHPKVARELAGGIKMPTLDARFGFLKTSPAYIMDVHTDPAIQLEWLAQVKADYLVSYPSNLLALSHLNNQRAEPVRFFRIRSLSEELTADDARAIQMSFHSFVTNSYSSYESGPIATTCTKGMMHVHEENVHIEIVDDQGRPRGCAQEGRVLVTTLQNFAMPLVRYDIGDRASWAIGCDCGLPHRVMYWPQGKRHPLFTLPDGLQQKNSIGIAAAVRRIGGVVQFRVTQKAPNRILFELVPGPDWGADKQADNRQFLTEFLESSDIQVHFVEYPTRLPLRDGGKSPHLVTEVKDPAGQLEAE